MRVVSVWPRFALLESARLSVSSSSPSTPTGSLFDALSAIEHPFVRREDWMNIHAPRAGFSRSFASVIFDATIHAHWVLTRDSHIEQPSGNEETACRSELVFVLLIASATARGLTFLGPAKGKFVELALKAASGRQMSEEEEVTEDLLDNLNFLFEGAVADEGTILPDKLIVRKLSEIVRERTMTVNNKLTVRQLKTVIANSIRDDPVRVPSEKLIRDVGGTKKMWGAVDPWRRTMLLHSWTKIEVLNNECYMGCNVKLVKGAKGCSSVFVPHWCESAYVMDCHGCGDIVLGPVRSLVVLSDVSDCRVSAVCARVIIRRCERVTLCLSCAFSPIVIQSTDIRFGPYDGFYNFLQHALRESGMRLWDHCGKWDQPIMADTIFEADERHGQCTDSSGVTLLETASFALHPTPLPVTDTDFKKVFLDSLPDPFRNAAVTSHQRAAVAMRTWTQSGQPIPKVISEEDRLHLEKKVKLGIKQTAAH